jgi:hypothetical protein
MIFFAALTPGMEWNCRSGEESTKTVASNKEFLTANQVSSYCRNAAGDGIPE